MGSLLRATLGPQTRASWPAWGYYDDQAITLPGFGSPCEEEPSEGKRRQ